MNNSVNWSNFISRSVNMCPLLAADIDKFADSKWLATQEANELKTIFIISHSCHLLQFI